MKYQKILVTALSLLAISGQAAAQGYGMAGCGLGSIVANEMNWGNDKTQIFAMTTNGTAGSQTFGISFGTSNCAHSENAEERPKSRKKKKQAERKVFLQYNLAHVKADAARGSGDYIASLANLYGCQNQWTGNYESFATLSQKHHIDIFGANEPEAVLRNYERILNSEQLACAID